MALPAMDMILPQSSNGSIPAFLAKLWKMVNNPEIGKFLILKKTYGMKKNRATMKQSLIYLQIA